MTCIFSLLDLWNIAYSSLSCRSHSSGGLVTKSCQSLATLLTVARQAPLSMGFPRQEYWPRLHFFFQRISLTQGSNPSLLNCRSFCILQVDTLQLSQQGCFGYKMFNILCNKYINLFLMISVLYLATYHSYPEFPKIHYSVQASVYISCYMFIPIEINFMPNVR